MKKLEKVIQIQVWGSYLVALTEKGSMLICKNPDNVNTNWEKIEVPKIQEMKPLVK